MKKQIKRILITAAALIIVIAAGVFIYILPMLSMKPHPTGIVPGTDIISVQNRKNSLYFIPSGENSYIAVDAGSNADQVLKAMTAQGIDPLAVTDVLLTHTDSDHTAALSLFSNARIYMSVDEKQMIDGTVKRNLIEKNQLPEEVQGRTILIQEEEILELGAHSIVCYNIPGHTPGSMAFVVDSQYLFSGDAAAIQDEQAAVHPYSMDKQKSQESIYKLLDLIDEGYIFTAHYGVYKAGTILD